jgi:membrane dipeptidase
MESGCCGCLGPAGRRAFLASLLGAVAAACAGPGREAADRRERDLAAQSAAVVGGRPVFDLHAHPGAFTRASTGSLPPGALDEMTAGGVDAAFFAAVSDGLVIRREPDGIRNYRDPAPGELHRNTMAQLARVRARADEGHVQLLRAPADLAAARARGVRGALMALEGGDALEGRVDRVREFHELGVRSIQLVHFRINELGDIQTAPTRHGRLTDAGAAVVGEMNRLGMIVDGAHAARQTLLDILAVSHTPIIVSHTGPAALRRSRRHLTDELLRAVAAKGGVIGVWPMTSPGATSIEDFARELAYVRDLVGVDHVGIGTDMAGLATSTSILTYREFAPVPAALLAAGFVEADVRKVLGGNVARVFEMVAGV